MKTIHLALSELSCQHCVKNVTKTLSAIEGVEKLEVTLNQATILTNQDAQLFIDAIVDAGYQATLLEITEVSHPKSNLLPETNNHEQNPDPMVVENTEDQVMLLLSGLSCIACVRRVEKVLLSIPKVNQVNINLAEQTALISSNISPHLLIQAIQQAGYGAELIEDEQTRRDKQRQQTQQEIRLRQKQGIVALILGAVLMLWGLLGGSMMLDDASRPYWLIVGILTLAVMIFSGKHFYQSAVINLKKKTTTMDTLVALGTGTAWVYSMLVCLIPDFFPEQTRHLYFEASAMILGLINIGKMLETKAKQRSSEALSRLLNLTPPTAILVEAQEEREIPLKQVKTGMLLRLRTGERIAVDGTILQGNAWIDESMLTGEPVPVEKSVGDKVSAGTLVTDGTLIFRVEQIGQQTTLAHIIRLVRQAQSSKPQLAQLADKISAIFVPTVMVIAFLSALLWFYIGPQPPYSYSLVILTTVLIIACPCALGLATPMSIIAGVARAAELGILVRNVDALQKATDADTLVFDKTGTLTQGEPQVTAVVCINQTQETEMIQLAATLEQGSHHPLAKAILNLAAEKQIYLSQVTEFQTLGGLGLQGRVNQQNILLGNRTLMQQKHIDFSNVESLLAQYQQGETFVFLAIENRLAAFFVLQDQLRQDSAATLSQLKQRGYRLIMLTGDQKQSAYHIAEQLSIDEVIPEVLPKEKAEIIQKLQTQGRKIVMIGDGINDAPALAQADVSIAMGTGTDIAIETADLTLMRQGISAVADSLILSKGILRNIKQNLFAAFIYNIIGIPIAAGILYPFWGLLLDPMIAGAAMALSSITVVSNANRLLKFKI